METEKRHRAAVWPPAKKAALIAGLLLICIVSAFFYFYSISQDLREEAATVVQNQVNQGILFTERTLARNLDDIGNAALLAVEYEQPEEHLEELFRQLETVRDICGYERIGYVDVEGILRFTSGETLNIREEPAFAVCQTGKSYVSDPFMDRISGKKVVTISAPILREGSFLGMIAASAAYGEFQERLVKGFDGEYGFAYLIDEEGDILFRTENAPYNPESPNYYSNVEAILSNGADSMRKLKEDLSQNRSGAVDLNGKNRTNGSKIQGYIGYAPVAMKPEWHIVSYVPFSVITEGSQRILWKSALAACGIVLAFGIMLFLVTFIEKKKNSRMRDLLYRDMLTGIPNNTYFEEKAAALLKEHPQERYTIIRFDINNFKFLNDTYGYGMGDTLLRVFAKTLSENYTEREIAARMNSDHFVLLTSRKGGQIARLRGMLKESLAENFTASVANTLTCSYGLYELKDNTETIKSAIDKANVALKEAKSRPGRYAAVYNAQLLERIDEEARLTMKMKPALEQYEFKVYLQPKFDISTMKFVGGEALVRWISPELGFLPPDSFIPLFEKNGFIAELDFYVFEQVCRRFRRLLDAGIELKPISVNWSRITLMLPNYLTRLTEILDRYQLSSEYIEMEVTESAFTKNYNYILRVLENVKKLGFALVMDDFGSDYSSLKLLKNLPFDVLKIDKGFLDESFTTDRTYHIIRCVIEMGKALHIQVVCEGVETAEHVEMLRKLGCDVGQGYYFAKPMSIDEFDRVIHGISSEPVEK